MKTLSDVYSLIAERSDYDRETDFFGGDCHGLYCIGYNAISIYESATDGITSRIVNPFTATTYKKSADDNYTKIYNILAAF